MKLNEIVQKISEKYNIDSLEISSSPRELIIMLLMNSKKCNYADIVLGNIQILDNDYEIIDDMFSKIVQDKIPPQYLTKMVNIYNESYYVDENVLIPRQDSETIIEKAIEIIGKSNLKTMLDMCTGSGVIGISVACNSSIEKVTLVDISSQALQVANKNISINDCEDKCQTQISDLFSKLYESNNKYDIITANPPYLTKIEMNELTEYVKKEPSLALYGGRDGLDYYRKIIDEARHFLNNNGYLVMEIGYLQAIPVINILEKYKEYVNIEIIKDINEKDRVIVCHFQKQ